MGLGLVGSGISSHAEEHTMQSSTNTYDCDCRIPCSMLMEHQVAIRVVQHRRGRRRGGVGAVRGRAIRGCEEVGTGADSQCSQRGAFSVVGSEVVRVGPRSVKVDEHYPIRSN